MATSAIRYFETKIFFMMAILILQLGVGAFTKSEVTIAVLLPFSGPRPIGRTVASAAAIAVDDINKNQQLLPSTTLNFVWNDTRCDETQGLATIVNYLTNPKTIDAFIGPGCDEVCRAGGLLASYWNVPMVSWGCTSSTLTDTERYPTFARTVGSLTQVAPLVAAVIKHWQWRNACILTSTNAMWQHTAKAIQFTLVENGINVKYYQSFEPGPSQRNRQKIIVQEARQTCRSKIIRVQN